GIAKIVAITTSPQSGEKFAPPSGSATPEQRLYSGEVSVIWRPSGSYAHTMYFCAPLGGWLRVGGPYFLTRACSTESIVGLRPSANHSSRATLITRSSPGMPIVPTYHFESPGFMSSCTRLPLR